MIAAPTIVFPPDLTPFAISIVIGTYSWRLPGCEFGSTSRKTGEPIPVNPGLCGYMRSLAADEPCNLRQNERAFIIDATFRFGVRNRIIIDAVNFGRNHGHILMYPQKLLPSLGSGQTFSECSKIIQEYKIFLTAGIHRRFPRLRNRKIWARGYNCSLVFSFKGWYNRFNYVLFKQESNSYFRYSYFARLTRLQFDQFCEPLPASLVNAFANYKIQSIRKGAMPYELTYDENAFAVDDGSGD